MQTLLLLALSAAVTADTGPRPGDVYREFATHNSGDDWRVTDPQAAAEGAQKFLPNPVLQLHIDDLQGAIRAEALVDRWGGHLRTTDKRIRFNGHDWITLPELSTTPAGRRPELYYSQDNPTVNVPLAHLREGENTLEGTCGVIGDYNWGQWGLYSLILRVYYDPQQLAHPRGRITDPTGGATLGENPVVTVAAESAAGIAGVEVLAWYEGYDENGDGLFADWHGGYFQPVRGQPARLAGHVGTADSSPFHVTWDTHWVPDQRPRSVKLIARIRDRRGVWLVTETVDNLSLMRDGCSVKLYRSTDVPERFGVRVGRTASCTMALGGEDDLALAVEAGLALRTWHGWDGHHEPLQLNQHSMQIEGKNHHYDHDILSLPVTALRPGENVFRIHSQTEHHMLEVLWPGPALLVRYGTACESPSSR